MDNNHTAESHTNEDQTRVYSSPYEDILNRWKAFDRAGDYINPYGKFYNAWVPEWLLCRNIKEVSNGAKLLYGKLCQHAGKNGDCFPKQKTLARELGMSPRSISRHLKELKDLGLIEPKRYGKKRANRYKFRRHEWMEFRHDDP